MMDSIVTIKLKKLYSKNNVLKLILFFLSLIYAVIYLVRFQKLRKINKAFLSEIKFRKRFIRGAILGYSISRYIRNTNHLYEIPKDIANGFIYGLWGVTVIALDAIQDNSDIECQEIEDVVSNCCSIISNKTDFKNLNAKSTPIYISYLLSNKIGISIQTFDTKNQRKFLKRAIELLHGQLNSLQQKDFNFEKDLPWYVNEISDNKNLNFYLAPLELYPFSNETDKNFQYLKSSFLKLNKCYFNWQFLDDIVDIYSDSDNKVIGFAGFVLISQGKIAEKIISKSNMRNNIEELKTELKKSLLIDWDLNHIEFRSNDSIDSLIRKAFCNSSKEHGLPLKKLLKGKITTVYILKELYYKNQTKEFVHTILETGICERVINSSLSQKYLNNFFHSVENKGDKLIFTLLLINFMMNKTYNNAIQSIKDFKTNI